MIVEPVKKNKNKRFLLYFYVLGNMKILEIEIMALLGKTLADKSSRHVLKSFENLEYDINIS